MSDWLPETLKAILTFGTGGLATWATLRTSKRNADVAVEDNREKNANEALKASNDAWREFAESMKTEMDTLRKEQHELSERVAVVEAANRELRAENERLHRERQALERKVKAQQDAVTKAVELLLQYVEWLDTGAIPPQPVKLPDVIRQLNFIMKGK